MSTGSTFGPAGSPGTQGPQGSPTPRPGILVADTDEEFLARLRSDPLVQNFPLFTALSGWEAQMLVANLEKPICALFVSPAVQNPSWFSVIRSWFQHRPACPVFILRDRSIGEIPSEEELRRAGVKQAIDKPVNYRRMLDLAVPIHLGFDAQSALEKAKLNRDALDSETIASDSEFVAVRARDFASGSQSYFDVYVKLVSGKFLKLLQAGDEFSAERLENYIKKGVSHFFIRKEAQEEYISYCDSLAAAVVQIPTTSPEVASFQTRQVMHQGEQTLRFLDEQGVTEVNIKYAAKFLRNVHHLVKEIQVEPDDWLKQFFGNLAAYDHAIGTTMLACILAQTLEVQMERPVQIIGMAGLFHHLGLSSMPEDLWDEDESRMTPEQRKLYRTHPTLAVEKLRGLGNAIESVTLQAIEQHHMRPGGKGFPEKNTPSPLHPIGQMIGICSEFNHYLKKHKGDAQAILKILEERTFPLFSRQVVYGFRTAFYPTSK